jgi:hypothetical protein
MFAPEERGFGYELVESKSLDKLMWIFNDFKEFSRMVFFVIPYSSLVYNVKSLPPTIKLSLFSSLSWESSCFNPRWLEIDMLDLGRSSPSLLSKFG